jgi:hypothetical protein
MAAASSAAAAASSLPSMRRAPTSRHLHSLGPRGGVLRNVDPQAGIGNGAISLLIWTALQEAASYGRTFDLDGTISGRTTCF